MRNTVNILNRKSKLCRKSGHKKENITEMSETSPLIIQEIAHWELTGYK
jgi:hypothetical protein